MANGKDASLMTQRRILLAEKLQHKVVLLAEMVDCEVVPWDLHLILQKFEAITQPHRSTAPDQYNLSAIRLPNLLLTHLKA